MCGHGGGVGDVSKGLVDVIFHLLNLHDVNDGLVIGDWRWFDLIMVVMMGLGGCGGDDGARCLGW